MNLPNKLTMFRIFLSLPLIVLLSLFAWYVIVIEKNSFGDVSTSTNSQYFLYASGIIFIISMITDFFDGYLARKKQLITEFGKLFDPLADKIITTTTMIFLAFFNYSYLICVIVIIIRDLIVDGSRNVAAKNNLKIEASIWGKLKTLIQSIALPIIIFLIPVIDEKIWWELFIINIPLIIATILSIISGVIYFKEIYPIIKKDR